jgi:hypothetical protein
VYIGEFHSGAATAAAEFTFMNYRVAVKNKHFGFILQYLAFGTFINLKTSFKVQVVVTFCQIFQYFMRFVMKKFFALQQVF